MSVEDLRKSSFLITLFNTCRAVSGQRHEIPFPWLLLQYVILHVATLQLFYMLSLFYASKDQIFYLKKVKLRIFTAARLGWNNLGRRQ